MYYNGRYVRPSTGNPAVENMDDQEVIVTTSGSHLKKYYDGEPKAVEKPEKKKVRCPLINSKCMESCAWYDSGKCGKITGAPVKVEGFCPMSGANVRECSTECPLYNAGICALEAPN